MRILHILDHSIPIHSGYSFRTRSILEHQRALGWHTDHVTSTKHASNGTDVETVDGFTFYRTRPSPSALARLPVLNQLAVVTTLRKRLDELVPKLRPDVLHAHSPSLTGLAALHAGRRFGIPVVYEVRALWEEGAVVFGRSRPGGLYYTASRALENHVLRRCDQVVTICDGLRGELLSRGLTPDKVAIVGNGVNLGQFAFKRPVDVELVRALGLENHTIFGYIGSLNSYEGLGSLIQAVSSIRERHPAVRLLLVGGGQQDNELRRMAETLGGNSVIFAGQVPHADIQRYYSVMDYCVYPRLPGRALDLTTPLKPLEAMAQGKLVIASDVGGHKELIQHGRTGLLFRAGDTTSLSEMLCSVLEKRVDVERLRDSARHYVETERSWPRLISGYASVYEHARARREAVAPL